MKKGPVSEQGDWEKKKRWKRLSVYVYPGRFQRENPSKINGGREKGEGNRLGIVKRGDLTKMPRSRQV